MSLINNSLLMLLMVVRPGIFCFNPFKSAKEFIPKKANLDVLNTF